MADKIKNACWRGVRNLNSKVCDRCGTTSKLLRIFTQGTQETGYYNQCEYCQFPQLEQAFRKCIQAGSRLPEQLIIKWKKEHPLHLDKVGNIKEGKQPSRMHLWQEYLKNDT